MSRSEASVKRERRDFVLDGSCAKCGGRPSDCHEIHAGSHRHKSYYSRACWLRLCREPCHRAVQGSDKTRQLMLKILNDMEGFDLVEFHEVWGRPISAITAEDLSVLGEDHPHGNTKQLRGRRFGRLMVFGWDKARSENHVRWICVCDCGKATSVKAGELYSGGTKSCGCLHLEAITKHGQTRLKAEHQSPAYKSWSAARSRCGTMSDSTYEHYGGRGIAMCERWNIFENFLADMGEQPQGTSLDRIDNDGNYEPDNCRWATSLQQRRNTRRNTYLTIGGRRMIVADWAKHSGTQDSTIRQRLKRGWPVREAVFGRAK